MSRRRSTGGKAALVIAAAFATYLAVYALVLCFIIGVIVFALNLFGVL